LYSRSDKKQGTGERHFQNCKFDKAVTADGENQSYYRFEESVEEGFKYKFLLTIDCISDVYVLE